MGDVASGHISKGIIHAKVDAVVNHMDGKVFDKRAAFLKALKEADTFPAYQSLLETQAAGSRAETTYLRDTFYSNPNVWWPGVKNVYDVLHLGFVKALEEAGDNLLLDSYWLPAAGFQGVEVIICKSEKQVTRIFLTPPVLSGGPMNPRHTKVPIWVISQSDSPSPVGTETHDAIVEKVQGKIVTSRRKEFP